MVQFSFNRYNHIKRFVLEAKGAKINFFYIFGVIAMKRDILFFNVGERASTVKHNSKIKLKIETNAFF